MGAKPLGMLLGLGCGPLQDDAWLSAFADGLKRALERWDVPLLGGDTVAGLAQAVFGLTALGSVEPGTALVRSGARAGDDLWVSGTIGDAGLGLTIAQGDAPPDKFLLNRFRRPEPRLALGQALVGVATAAIDVSDGVLIDASRLAVASGLAVTVDLAALPLSPAAAARTADTDAARLERATAGDDYELLFAAPPGATLPQSRVPLTRIGRFDAGAGLVVTGRSGTRVTPDRLGWEHATARG
jgi:thiamine-monophosphate kinase